MSGILISLLAAVSMTVWVYTKLARRTGVDNRKGAVIGALAAGFMIFLFFFTLLKFILNIQ